MEIVRAFFGEGETGALPSEDCAESLSDHEGQCRMNCAFLVAAINGQTEVIDLLLDRGMDIDMQPPGSDFAGIGGTALHWAARYGRNATVERLIERGANVLAEDDTFFLTPAGWSSWNNHEDTRRLLLGAERDSEQK